ncbi:MAG: RDD family protein [Rickettsiales bacterium]|jgi:hypothetical protein|nr:RDD family protein [Rickettsiales bacterium]
MKETNCNARGYKRIISFVLDVFFVNFIKTLLIQLLILSRPKIIQLQEFWNNFVELFGKVSIVEIKDYHLRYIVNNSRIFNYIFTALLIISFSGVIYTFLSTVFLNEATLGQRIMSLRVVDRKDNGKKPGILKLLARSILVPLPLTNTVLFLVSFGLHFLNFQLYAPENNWQITAMVKLTNLAEHLYIIGTILCFFAVFWYGVYYLTNRLIFSDILSGTRVIEIDKYGIPQGNTTDKDFVYFGDKFIGLLEKLNMFLLGLLKKAFHYIGAKFKGFRGGKNGGKK